MTDEEAFRVMRDTGICVMDMPTADAVHITELFRIWSQSCERCMNVIAYKHLNGKDGSPEYSSGTKCEFCKDDILLRFKDRILEENDGGDPYKIADEIIKHYLNNDYCTKMIGTDECDKRLDDGGGCFQCTVDRAHTVDAVPVVRCKWCKHSCVDRDNRLYCRKMNCVTVEPSGYCYKGEEKDD